MFVRVTRGLVVLWVLTYGIVTSGVMVDAASNNNELPVPNWKLTNPNVTVAFLNGVAYSPSQDVAVAVGSELANIQAALVVQENASTQQGSWFSASIPTTSAYFPSIVYNGESFIAAMGENLLLSVAPNTWLPIDLNYYLDSIAYGNGITIALNSLCSKPAKVAISTDGLTWNFASAPFECDSEQLYDHHQAYFDIYFIDGYFYSMGEKLIWKTENGYNWTQWSHSWNKIAPDDSLAVGLAAGIPANSSAPTPFILSTLFGDLFQTLDDGLTWEAIFRPKRDQYVGEQGFGAINVFDGNYYYNVGNGRTFYSTDLGQSWSLVPPPLNGFPYKFTTSSTQKDLYLAVGPNGLIQSSDDGISWNTLNEGIAEPFVGFAVDAINNQFVISSLGGFYVMNPPSTTWNKVQLASRLNEYAFAYSSFASSPTNAIYGNFAADYYGGTFSYSFDLINWVTSDTPSYGQDIRFTGMAFDPEQGIWVVAYDYFGYRQNIVVSTNYTGTEWKDAYNPPLGTVLQGPNYGAGLFILSSTEGDIYSSIDGLSWESVQCTKCPSGTIQYLNEYFIAYNNESIYFTTSDQLNEWQEVTLNGVPPRFIYTLTYFDDLEVYVVAFTAGEDCIWYYASHPAGPWQQPEGDIITSLPGCVTNIAHLPGVYVALDLSTNQIFVG